MEEVRIRFAKKDDIDNIMKFIKDYWSEKHIYANNKEFFEYMHLEGDDFNFVIGEGIETDKIYGMEGFVKYNYTNTPDISGCMWKTIKSSNIMLGIDIDKFMAKETNSRVYCGGGVNINTSGKIAKLLGYGTGKLLHYYRLNDLPKYKIAVVNNKDIPLYLKVDIKYGEITSFKEFDENFSNDILKKMIPYKDKKYLKHRYFDHPVYKYKFYSILNNEDKITSVIIGREIEQNDTKIFRIMDFLGNDRDIAKIGKLIDNLITKNNYEYVDFYCYGINDEYLKEAGFVLRKENDENIIPNYFEPFEQKNVEIYFPMNKFENLHIYKGDGDQDRPSIIK